MTFRNNDNDSDYIIGINWHNILNCELLLLKSIFCSTRLIGSLLKWKAMTSNASSSSSQRIINPGSAINSIKAIMYLLKGQNIFYEQILCFRSPCHNMQFISETYNIIRFRPAVAEQIGDSAGPETIFSFHHCIFINDQYGFSRFPFTNQLIPNLLECVWKHCFPHFYSAEYPVFGNAFSADPKFRWTLNPKSVMIN